MLVPSQRVVVAQPDATVVSRKHDQCVGPHLRGGQRGGQVAHRRVQHVQHVRQDVVLCMPGRIHRLRPAERRVFVDLPRERERVRGVDVLDGVVEPERLRGLAGGMLCDDAAGSLRVKVGAIIDEGDEIDGWLVVAPEIVVTLCRVLVSTAPLVRLRAAQIADVAVKPAVDHQVVLGVPSQVALSNEVARVVGAAAELLREDREVEGHPVGAATRTQSLRDVDIATPPNVLQMYAVGIPCVLTWEPGRSRCGSGSGR